MEGTVFRSPAVAALMKEHFVESRQHIDIKKHLTDAQLAENQRLRTELAGDTIAAPYFVVIDPKTGKKLGQHSLSGGPGAWEPGWIEFLTEMIQIAGR